MELAHFLIFRENLQNEENIVKEEISHHGSVCVVVVIMIIMIIMQYFHKTTPN